MNFHHMFTVGKKLILVQHAPMCLDRPMFLLDTRNSMRVLFHRHVNRYGMTLFHKVSQRSDGQMGRLYPPH